MGNCLNIVFKKLQSVTMNSLGKTQVDVSTGAGTLELYTQADGSLKLPPGKCWEIFSEDPVDCEGSAGTVELYTQADSSLKFPPDKCLEFFLEDLKRVDC